MLAAIHAKADNETMVRKYVTDHGLKWDNFDISSFMAKIGKCRFCKADIHPFEIHVTERFILVYCRSCRQYRRFLSA